MSHKQCYEKREVLIRTVSDLRIRLGAALILNNLLSGYADHKYNCAVVGDATKECDCGWVETREAVIPSSPDTEEVKP